MYFLPRKMYWKIHSKHCINLLNGELTCPTDVRNGSPISIAYAGVSWCFLVRATESIQFSPAPRCIFSRGEELRCDNQIHSGIFPETSTSSQRCWCFFSFLSVLHTKKRYFPRKRRWCYFNKPFLRAAFESPWDSRGGTFSDFIK